MKKLKKNRQKNEKNKRKTLTSWNHHGIIYLVGWQGNKRAGNPLEGYPSWPKGTDCKSVSCAFTGSNPVPSIECRGVEQLAARRAHNPKVAGSSPVPAIFADIAQSVERHLGKVEVSSSNLDISLWRYSSAG